MAKAYNHQQVEEVLYRFWEEHGYFTPKVDWGKQPFTIVLPPPNVTGELHHGHAMVIAFQDLMVRWHRMLGQPTLWLPGTDHAGIATQNVVEAQLAREGITRHQLGREEFVRRVWEWRKKYGGIIVEQQRRMGASCDWTRERFTLDEGLSRAVRETFVRLYRRGLIYRGEYIINWCPRCETAISDLEVDHEERAAKLYYVRYPLENSDEYITVATTRPETILGDTAVAVHPDDARYTRLVGRRVVLPEVSRHIPIIADLAVDPSFGTGAVKVTPAHDPVDYEIGKRAGLASINVMDEKGVMNENAGRYAGMDRFACRKALVEDLEKEGLLVKIEDYQHAVGRCQRCRTDVEPRVSTQWFVRIEPLAKPAIAAVREGRIRFVPERFAKVYFNWMENIRDWCISRQLWWGHRIPVWYCDDCGETIVATEAPASCTKCQGSRLTQDPDVLDTWFSSGLWPFSTLGWPDDTEDFRYFYPTSVMETGYDIIFFWVARMIMLGLECTGDVPFRYVYLHGLMRDEKGEKMSKSKGNTANPLDVIQQYGADALRFTIVTGSSPGNDMKLTNERLEGSRNFANKLWNAARFAFGFREVMGERGSLTLEDRWILSRLSGVVTDVNRLMEEWLFGEAGRTIEAFTWDEFCDWYLETAKQRLYGDDQAAKATAASVMRQVLDTILRLLHPFMPFVTEEIRQHLPHQGESLMVAAWPRPGERDPEAEQEMSALIEVIRSIRNLRAEFRVEAARWVEAKIVAGPQAPLLSQHQEMVATLARVRPLRVVAELPQRPAQALHAVAAGTEIYLPLAGLVDVEAELARLGKELAALGQEIERTKMRLASPGFTQKAPPAVVERERSKLAELEERHAKLLERLALLEEK
ncbi:MAG: valine--tRNA ligase [Bacteroidetes bacterium]|nr:valine--tRNA ligase [Bacteroidota bacterium]